jgi:ATP-binding protein involved in chromosome partitioning
MTPSRHEVEAESIDVERDVGITIVFSDGLSHLFANVDLRMNCPCATCRGFRDQGEPAWPRPGGDTTARIEDARLVGAWGIGILWNDGHDTGIFPWSGLHEWAEGEAP